MIEKLTIIKPISLLVLFLAVLSIGFAMQDVEATEVTYATFQESDMPVMYMTSPEGRLINPAFGYTEEVDFRLLYNGITPLKEDRTTKVYFYNYNSNIREISFQVRDVLTDQLLENTAIKKFEVQNDYVMAELPIKNLIEKDKEYLLTVIISTDSTKDIRYHERIILSDNLLLDDKIAFAQEFNSYTYSSTNLSKISEWIETDETGDNTNYGHVTIHSTRAQIGWGDLNPRIEGNVVPTVWELTPTYGNISLNYRVVTTTSNNEVEAYEVKDYYKIIQKNDKIYLMDYDREANQIFDAYNDLQASGRINLGIRYKQEEIEAKSNKTGKFSYFAIDGRLWCYSRNDNRFVNVFSFETSEYNRLRSYKDEYSIKIIDVSEEGNVRFSVCGHMMGGAHDGKTGLAMYEYDYSTNITNELVYIPVNVPYKTIKENVGDVSHIVGDIYYVKINQYLYSIDLVGGEYMLITDELYEGTYSVNKNGNKIAYHSNHDENITNEIRVYNMDEGKEDVIKPNTFGDGAATDNIKIIGYLENDLVYGLICPDDIYTEFFKTEYPMYALIILSDEHEVVKKYENYGIYVSEAEVDGMRINLSRCIKQEDGTFRETSVDQLLNKSENENVDSIFTEIVNTYAREKEIYLNIPTSSGDTENVEIIAAKEIQYQNTKEYNLENDYKFARNYYVYGTGKYQDRYNELQKAISAAGSLDGMVLDERGNYVWKRTESNKSTVWDKETFELDITKHTLNITGINFDYMLYYVSIGKLVAARMGEDKYVVIYDYDNKSIMYYDFELKKDVTLDRDIALRKFLNWRNEFLVLD